MSVHDKIEQKIDQLYALRRYVDAEDLILKLVAVEPHNVWAFCKLSRIYIKLKNAEKAAEVARKAVSIDPEYTDAISVLSWSLHFLGETDKAIEAARQVIAVEPLDPESYNLMSWVLSRTLNWEEALEYSYKGLELSPDHVGLWNAQIRNLMNLEKWEEAIDAIQHSLSLDPNKFFTYSALGGCYYKKRDFKRSEEFLLEALKIVPDNSTARKMLKEVQFRQTRLGKITRLFLKKELRALPL